MSTEHTLEIGDDLFTTIRLVIVEPEVENGCKSPVSARLFAYEKHTGAPSFACKVTLSDLGRLYQFLLHYEAVRSCSTKFRGSLVEVSPEEEYLKSLLVRAKTEDVIHALKGLLGSKLTEKDVNVILGRKESLATFAEMLANPCGEGKWQRFFERNEWIFGYGLKYKYLRILQREARVSNSDLDGKNAVFADFLLSDSRFTKLVELKRPQTPLFKKSQNRSDSWCLSGCLTNAVCQILAQKANWEVQSKIPQYDSKGEPLAEVSHDVESILIIGMHSEINGSPREMAMKRKTFELYRRNFRNIEILTFDELYERARFIVEGTLPRQPKS